MDFIEKSYYIEKELTPVLAPLGFQFESWDAEEDGNGWQYTRGNQIIDIYDKFRYINMRFIVNFPKNEAYANILACEKKIDEQSDVAPVYFYKTSKDFEAIIELFRKIIIEKGLRKLEEMCNPITDENPIRDKRYFERLNNNKNDAISKFASNCSSMASQLVLAGICINVNWLANKLFDDAVDDLIDMAAVYGDWIIKNFGGEWKNENGICMISCAKSEEILIIPTDDIFQAWSGTKILFDNELNKKLGKPIIFGKPEDESV